MGEIVSILLACCGVERDKEREGGRLKEVGGREEKRREEKRSIK